MDDRQRRLETALSGLSAEEFERVAPRIRNADIGAGVAEEEYLSYRIAAARRALGHPEPKMGRAAVWALVILAAAIVTWLAVYNVGR